MPLRRPVICRLRFYECLQLLVPEVAGLLEGGGGSLAAPSGVLLFLTGALLHQLFAYTYNDACDFEIDQLNPRKEGTGARPGRTEAPSQIELQRLSGIFFLLSTVCFLFLPVPVALIMAGIQILCWAYSHPRLRLKAHPPAAQLLHFLAGSGYFLAGRLMSGVPVESGSWLMAGYFGLVYLSGGLNNELMDHEADRDSGVRTFSVRHGRKVSSVWVKTAQLGALITLCPAFASRVPVLISVPAVVTVYWLLIGGFLSAESSQASFLAFRKRYRLFFGGVTAVAIFGRLIR